MAAKSSWKVSQEKVQEWGSPSPFRVEGVNAMTNEIHVLIVDDEAELRKSVASVLCATMPEFRFTINEATNGREALRLVDEVSKSGGFDLVLMDVRMPEMDGLEALGQIKALDPRIF